MRIAQKVAGYSLAQADILRKAMGKKLRPCRGVRELLGGHAVQRVLRAAIKALWDTILPFADYAFNKSHAAGYGMVSYWTAYLKANYPAEYMAGLLTAGRDDKDKAAVYLADCRKLGIIRVAAGRQLNRASTSPPSAPTSATGWVRCAMSAPMSLPRWSIPAPRRASSPIFSDYLNKVDIAACNKKVTESLIKAGAFDSLAIPARACSGGVPTPSTRCWAPRRPRRWASSTFRRK